MPFSSKIALHLKKVCYTVSLREYCLQKSCTAFTGLSNHAQMVGGGRPLLPENLAETDPSPSKRRFPIDILS